MGKALAEAELTTAIERISSFLDDYRASRWGSATINLYFGLEHLVKALLASVGLEPKSHEGVRVLFSMHFIKTGKVSPKIGRYLGNLYERRTTAEYSPLRRAEFTKEEVDTYLKWVKEATDEMLPLLKDYGLPVEDLLNKLDLKENR